MFGCLHFSLPVALIIAGAVPATCRHRGDDDTPGGRTSRSLRR